MELLRAVQVLEINVRLVTSAQRGKKHVHLVQRVPCQVICRMPALRVKTRPSRTLLDSLRAVCHVQQTQWLVLIIPRV